MIGSVSTPEDQSINCLSCCVLLSSSSCSAPTHTVLLSWWLSSTKPDRAFARQQSGVGGPYLGLEPGLGLTTPLLDHHKQQHDKASAAAAAAASDTTSVAAAAGTPHSEVDADAARPFGSITAAAADGSAGEAAAAAAAAIAAAGAATSASRTADAKKSEWR